MYQKNRQLYSDDRCQLKFGMQKFLMQTSKEKHKIFTSDMF